MKHFELPRSDRLAADGINAWLNPDSKNLDAMHAILEDRARRYYEHRMAA